MQDPDTEIMLKIKAMMDLLFTDHIPPSEFIEQSRSLIAEMEELDGGMLSLFYSQCLAGDPDASNREFKALTCLGFGLYTGLRMAFLAIEDIYARLGSRKETEQEWQNRWIENFARNIPDAIQDFDLFLYEADGSDGKEADEDD